MFVFPDIVMPQRMVESECLVLCTVLNLIMAKVKPVDIDRKASVPKHSEYKHQVVSRLVRKKDLWNDEGRSQIAAVIITSSKTRW
jgi:hypothetical protein